MARRPRALAAAAGIASTKFWRSFNTAGRRWPSAGVVCGPVVFDRTSVITRHVSFLHLAAAILFRGRDPPRGHAPRRKHGRGSRLRFSISASNLRGVAAIRSFDTAVRQPDCSRHPGPHGRDGWLLRSTPARGFRRARIRRANCSRRVARALRLSLPRGFRRKKFSGLVQSLVSWRSRQSSLAQFEATHERQFFITGTDRALQDDLSRAALCRS